MGSNSWGLQVGRVYYKRATNTNMNPVMNTRGGVAMSRTAIDATKSSDIDREIAILQTLTERFEKLCSDMDSKLSSILVDPTPIVPIDSVPKAPARSGKARMLEEITGRLQTSLDRFTDLYERIDL